MKRIALIWLSGIVVFFAILLTGMSLNYRTSTIAPDAIPEGHCEEYRLDYIACKSDQESGRFFVTGWPTKSFCYDSGKTACSPWDDYLRIERYGTQQENQQGNHAYILLGSAVLALGAVATALSMKGKNAHNRH